MGSHSVTYHPAVVRIPPLPPAEAGTRFSNPGGMQGWVDLCHVKTDRLGFEPATCQSQVQRPTAAPPRNTYYENEHTCVIMQRISLFCHSDHIERSTFVISFSWTWYFYATYWESCCSNFIHCRRNQATSGTTYRPSVGDTFHNEKKPALTRVQTLTPAVCLGLVAYFDLLPLMPK